MVGGLDVDRDLMRGWFANTLMRGYDHRESQLQPTIQSLTEQLKLQCQANEELEREWEEAWSNREEELQARMERVIEEKAIMRRRIGNQRRQLTELQAIVQKQYSMLGMAEFENQKLRTERQRPNTLCKHNCIVVTRRRWRDWLKLTFWCICIKCEEFAAGPIGDKTAAWRVAERLHRLTPESQRTLK